MIRPNPQVERDERLVAEIDGEPLFGGQTRRQPPSTLESPPETSLRRRSTTTTCANITPTAELVEDVARSERHLPEEVVPVLERIDRPLVVRERCRVRALRVVDRDQ